MAGEQEIFSGAGMDDLVKPARMEDVERVLAQEVAEWRTTP
jgi:hypothetical protein